MTFLKPVLRINKLLVSLFFLCFGAHSYAQTCEWLTAEASAGSQSSYCVTTDNINDVIIGGIYQSNNAFTTGAGSLSFSGNGPGFLIKYDMRGRAKWAISAAALSSTSNCTYYTLATDKFRNIYASGVIAGSIDFGNGVTISASGSSQQSVLVKYDSSGKALWARGISGGATSGIKKLFVDKQNNVNLGYTFQGTIDYSGTSISLTTNGGWDIALTKYTPGGDLIRARKFGGSGTDYFTDMGGDDNVNIYVVGYSYASFNFGSQQLNNDGTLLLKLDSSITPIKGTKTDFNVGSLPFAPTWGIAVLGTGDFAITAQFYDSVNFGNGVWLKSQWSQWDHNGKRLMCIVYYDNNLTAQWARKNTALANSRTTPIGGINESNDYFYLGGYLEGGSVQFGSSVLTFVGTPTTTQMFFAKIDLRGNILWAFASDALSSMSQLRGLKADDIGDLLITGNFMTKIKVFNQSSTGFGQANFYDVFTAKIYDYTITRGFVKSGPYCAGDTIEIPYIKKGFYDTGNQFIAQLSDSAGNFEGGLGYRELGRVNDTTTAIISGGLIKGQLPMFNVATNNHYRIRIMSTNPVVQSFYRADTLRLLIYSKDTANAGPDFYACSGQAIRLGTTGGSRWNWSPKTFMPKPADTANRQPLITPTQTTEYRVIISDSSGCGEIDTDYVIVNVRPAFKGSVKGDSIICQGYSHALKAVATGGDSSKYWYKWRVIGLNIDLSVTDSLVVAPTATATYRLITGDSCSAKIDTIFFKVAVNNVLNALTSPDTTICKGKSATLRVTGDACKPQYYKYQWYEVGNPALLGSNSTFTASPTTTTTYRVILSDTTTVLADTADVKVTIDNVFVVNATKDSTICVGQNMVLNADVISCDTSQMEYSWNNGLGLGQSKTVSPSTTTTYIVTGTNKFNGLTDTAKVTVNVRAPLLLVPSPDTGVCLGQSTVLTATTSGGNVPGHQVIWSEVGGPWTGTGKTATVSPIKTTVYRAILTDGCTTTPDTAFVTVSITGPLKITVNPDTTICIGQNAELRATTSGGDVVNHKVVWSEIGGPWSVVGKNTLVNPIKTTTYKALLSDGCTSPNDSAQITVTVRPQLKVTVNKDTTICVGQSAELRAVSQGGYIPSHSLIWSEVGGPWSVVGKNAIVSPTLTTTYRAVLSDGCTTPSDSAVITVTVRPPLSIVASAKDSICSNQILLLNAAVSGGNIPSHSILWTADSGPWTSTQNPTTDTPQITTTYIAKLSDNCSPDVHDTIKVIVLPVPKADFGVLPFEGCPPLSVMFTDLSTGNDTALNTWKIQSNEVLGVKEYSHEFVKSGKYGVGLTTSNALGCVDYIFKPNVVWVFDKPQAQFVAKPDIKEIESPVILYNQSRRATNYTWDMGDGHIITQNKTYDTLYTYTDTGEMTIKLVAQSEKGCLDTQSQLIRIHDKMNCIIPNAFTPNGDGINNIFSPVCLGVATYHITIFNRWGETVLDCNDCSWDGTYNGYAVPPGVYLYKLKINAHSHKEGTAFGTVQVLR